MPSKPEVEQYIKDNAIEAALAAAVSATVKARPLDALAYLSQELAKATKPVAPCFFTVYHTFVPDKAAAWWEQMMKMGPDDYRAMDLKNNKLGFHCHSFMPAGMEGPINCMWESMLIRTSRGLRTVRTATRTSPACCTYRRRRAACPRGGTHYCTYAVRVPASGVPYVPCNRDGLGLLWGGDNQRTVARQVSFDLRCVPLSLFVHDWKVRSKQ